MNEQDYRQQQWGQRPPPKRHTGRLVLLIIGVLVVVGAVIGATQAGDKSTDSTQATNALAAGMATSVAEKTWETVATLSGSSDQVGDPFQLTGNKCRATYTLESDVMAVLNIYVMEEGTYLDSDGGIPEAMAHESGVTTFMKAPGSYYLDVSSANCDWTVTLEEYR